MPTTYTPLRYPGGKTKLYDYVKTLIEYNALRGCTYVEPYAGGAGLSIKLLLKNDVQSIIINDYDPAIYAFWYSVLNHTPDLCQMIDDVHINIEEWYKQKKIYESQNIKNRLELGFATFFLNRTNVSGVIQGGVIGGLKQQGHYKLYDRFNKKNLIKKILQISERKKQIALCNMDAINFIQSKYISSSNSLFVYLDPPYVKKGSSLYKNSYIDKNHVHLATIIKQCSFKWMITYDAEPLIKELYSNELRSSEININYSINKAEKAKELVFFSNNLLLPQGYI